MSDRIPYQAGGAAQAFNRFAHGGMSGVSSAPGQSAHASPRGGVPTFGRFRHAMRLLPLFGLLPVVGWLPFVGPLSAGGVGFLFGRMTSRTGLGTGLLRELRGLFKSEAMRFSGYPAFAPNPYAYGVPGGMASAGVPQQVPPLPPRPPGRAWGQPSQPQWAPRPQAPSAESPQRMRTSQKRESAHQSTPGVQLAAQAPRASSTPRKMIEEMVESNPNMSVLDQSVPNVQPNARMLGKEQIEQIHATLTGQVAQLKLAEGFLEALREDLTSRLASAPPGAERLQLREASGALASHEKRLSEFRTKLSGAARTFIENFPEMFRTPER